VKIDNVKIADDRVELAIAGTGTQVYEGAVEYTMTAERDGKLKLYVEVFPRKAEVPLRPATPNRNVR